MTRPLPDEPIGTGRTAEVFDWGDGLVVKLLRPGFDPALLDTEADRTRRAVEAGAPAPRVEGVVDVDGRPGLVLQSVGSASVVPTMTAQPWRVRHVGRLLAATHADILRRPDAGLRSVKDRLAEAIESADVDAPVRTRALDHLGTLPDGDALLHGDFHPGNVFAGAAGPIVIDWLDAASGHPGADIARSRWLMSPSAIPADLPRRRRAVSMVSALQSIYTNAVLAKTGLEAVEVAAWELPVLVARVAEGIDRERDALEAAIGRLRRSR